MTKKQKDAIRVAILAIICGLVIWHAVQWHISGVYAEMFSYMEEGKGYITVLYNLGLMIVLGTAIGFLMEKIAELIGSSKALDR